jgi:TonB family protein
MKRLLSGAGAILAGLILGVTGAHAGPATVIQHPDWLEKPTADDMEHFYPSKARTDFVSGRATIVCDVTAEGLLVRCEAKSESPKGYGFGEAAVLLGGIFRMKPKTVDGQPVDGGVITIPIVFQAASKLAEIGDMAMVLTRTGTHPVVVAPPVETSDDLEAPTIACPDGVGMCQGHYFMWAQHPTAKENARLVAAAKPVEGTTFAVCTITTEGLLDGCDFFGDLTPRSEKAMREGVKRLKAPYKTADGLATASATVIIPFMWDWLTGVKTEDTP